MLSSFDLLEKTSLELVISLVGDCLDQLDALFAHEGVRSVLFLYDVAITQIRIVVASQGLRALGTVFHLVTVGVHLQQAIFD